MTEAECDRLVDSTSLALGVSKLVTHSYRQELYRESEGHPYVVKVLLGEVAKSKRLHKIERIVAGREDILTALFERTYASLSPGAQRVFLTLCSWSSAISKIGLEAVLLRPDNERMDVTEAIDELVRSSMVEVIQSETDNQLFLSVPLVAAVFGRQKLTVSPLRTAVQVDSELLQLMGPMTRTDIRRGLGSRVEHMFGIIAARIEKRQDTLKSYLPILEGIARSYPKAWWLLAELHAEQNTQNALLNAKNAVEQFLQNAPASLVTSYSWRKLAELCQRTDDALGEVNASVETCQYSTVPFHIISNAANRLNRLMAKNKLRLDTSEKNVLVRKLADVMSDRISEATDASDLSSLGWLYMHLGEREKTRVYAEAGLTMEPRHIYSTRLLSILENS
jgi:hypothetical protein